MASSANIEQCSLTGGRFKCLAMSVFLIPMTSSTILPLIHSVATELEAMAEPHPNEFSVPVPFRAHLQGKIEPGQTLFTHGNIPDGATRFEVNFLSGSPTIDPHVGDVVLHVSVDLMKAKLFSTQ